MKRFSAPSRKAGQFRFRSVGWLAALAVVAGLLSVPVAIAGFGNNFGGRAVGGVIVDASGMVRAATVAERTEGLNQLRTELAQPRGEMAGANDLRMISLRKLQEAIANQLQTGQELSDDLRMLAGLQRIEYVFVYPERNDIVLAGPAEPWVVREDASVVGKNSGRPTLLLSDLLTAFQGVEPSRQGGISCSIDPTAEGRQRLTKLLGRVRLQPGQDPRNLEPMMREAFGPQQVTLSGIPADSHYARVLVAADYQMKRIAMALEPSPVEGLPSYMEMARNAIHSDNANPRWWMACNYDAIKRDEHRLAWKIGGQGVKAMTAEEVFEDGQVRETGDRNKLAEKWAETMTEKFDELAARQSVFGDLRNIMDLSVVATLVMQEGLDQTAGLDLSVLLGKSVEVPTTSYNVPKAIAPECSFVRGARGWVVSASGGVEVTPFDVVAKQEVDATLVEVQQRATAAEKDTWWWNG
ncbi:MAG: DUF1598 domain-containing protein [Planctomycetaceae bacterium]|nr:DUF1598 domain-containing protein [Planctomycetaceae bacterium]